MVGTQLADNGHFCVDAGDCAKNNGGCSHRCLSAVGRVFCLCFDGYVLGNDWKTCQGIILKSPLVDLVEINCFILFSTLFDIA